MEGHIDRALIAPHTVTMLKKGWFDDAIGRLQGFEIFSGLMKDGNPERIPVDSSSSLMCLV